VKNIYIKAFVIALPLALAGCGGGGGGAMPTTQPAPPVPVTPAPPPTPPAAVQNLQVAVAPTYPVTSEEYGFFTAINTFRAGQGLGPLNQNTIMDKASAAHANYESLNFATLGLSHGEVAGAPGFTGANPQLRVQFQGGTTPTVSEEIGTPASLVTAPGVGASVADRLIATVYHRAGWMYQGITDIGVSVGVSDANWVTVTDNGYTTQQVNAGTYFGVYPLAGQSGVELHASAEIPTPYPETVTPHNVNMLTGYPISVASQESTTLTVTSFTVTQAGSSTPMATYPIYTNLSDPNLAGSINLAFLVTTQAFLPNTVYTVNFVGTVTGTATGTANGNAINKTWSFTTGNSTN
jgi:hypothetical protein